MTVKVYRSTDPSAPTLTGNPGSMIEVLDACLVNGFGGNTSAGWTKTFTGTNQAVYKQGAGSNQFHLNINDTFGLYCAIFGMETATGIDSGTNLFPTTAQVASPGLYWKKSTSSDVNNPWIIIATEKIFYIWVNFSGSNANNILYQYTSSNYYLFGCFGDFISNKESDSYSTIIIGSTSTNIMSNMTLTMSSQPTSSIPGNFVTRSYTGTGTSIPICKFTNYHQTNSVGYLNYEQISNNYVLHPIYIIEPSDNTTANDRGTLPGIFIYGHSYNTIRMADIATGTQIIGTGDLTGRTFELLKSDISNVIIAYEISNTW